MIRITLATAALVAVAFTSLQSVAGPSAGAPAGASACSGCHGLSPDASAGPPLRGRPAQEIADAMAAYRSGQRPATVMDRIARGFDLAETSAIATWIAGLR